MLVLSTFFPKAAWNVGLAMARNAYIYGLAKEIYVAESDSKGGTWEGVMDGMKRGRKIYVRNPDSSEKNANRKLIELGAAPVNSIGTPIIFEKSYSQDLFEAAEIGEVSEPSNNLESNKSDLEKNIIDLLNKGEYTSKEILQALNLDWDSRKMTNFLKKNPNVKMISGSKPSKFTLSDITSPTLF